MKTKLGVPVVLLSAAIYFVALFGGYTTLILLAGYALLFEEDEWLKRGAVRAVALTFTAALLVTIVGLLPDILSWVGSIVSVFKGTFTYPVISSLVAVITKAINFVTDILLISLGIKALKKETISIPVVDAIITKYM